MAPVAGLPNHQFHRGRSPPGPGGDLANRRCSTGRYGHIRGDGVKSLPREGGKYRRSREGERMEPMTFGRGLRHPLPACGRTPPPSGGEMLTRVSPPRRRGSTGEAGEGERMEPMTFGRGLRHPLPAYGRTPPPRGGETLTRVSPPRRRGSTGKAGEGERMEPITFDRGLRHPLPACGRTPPRGRGSTGEAGRGKGWSR